MKITYPLIIRKFHFIGIMIICLLPTLGKTFSPVDKIYHPYVEFDTWEIETRAISPLSSELSTDFSIYRIGIGKDILDNLFVEFYAIGSKNDRSIIDIESYEVEALYQLTEQGEYWLDVGLLLEIEKNIEKQKWEGNIALLVEKEFGRWSASLNLHQQYEFIDDRRHELKTKQAFQYRYRYSPLFEPGLEIYTDQQDTYIGLIVLSDFKQSASKIGWEFGLLKALSHAEDDTILRLLVEIEF